MFLVSEAVRQIGGLRHQRQGRAQPASVQQHARAHQNATPRYGCSRQSGAKSDRRAARCAAKQEGREGMVRCRCACSEYWLCSVQRLSLDAPKLAAELAQSPPGAPKSERMVRSFMFSPQPRNLAARPSSASSASPASASSSSAAAAPPAIDVDSLCLPDRDEGVHFCLLVV